MKTTLTRSQLKKDYPLCFNEFLKHGGDGFPDLLSALDSFLFTYGIGIKVQPIHAGGSERILGNELYINYYPGNALKHMETECQVIQDYRRFKDLRKARIVTFLAALDQLEEFLHRST